MGSPFKLLPAPKFQFKIHKVNHYVAGSAIVFANTYPLPG